MKINPLYILPNLFTGASIYLGILSVSYAFLGRFELACWLVLISLIFDGLDGRVARLTGTTSKFGVEFDSLADIIAFGVAPAMILFFYIGFSYGKLGIAISGLYVVFGAIRLARFNVSTGNSEPNVFIGLPIPAAAVFIVSWLMCEMVFAKLYPEYSKEFLFILMICVLLIGLLMVSNIRYPSFKKINFYNISFGKIIVFLMMFLAVLFIYPIYTVVSLITAYVFFGPLRAGYYIFFKKTIK
ncbi:MULTISPECIES: CDP-diacylglycerol--serine O-phosphatidyltransferase [Helicobacter]|uniref:CDP-diacylglycerol--serine O-phosphatidyltransferase n=1 Tax=Helicobacter ibis TaxID=2962633 RepID=A0ABT4VFM8_9HELI|nr:MULTISPECIES: CDP-diacylglycerol--serine O-phosphatidyltransferase [Helicobacter]MDA3967795.1 CDP-diacylglycerol--serine O-phosphatidyltransferase [Helicobacter sp. WB40]MDA3969510.1 CDP-diacylglycerol--serine O-phosphatidyltransferase [Helicobacter ibis]